MEKRLKREGALLARGRKDIVFRMVGQGMQLGDRSSFDFRITRYDQYRLHRREHFQKAGEWGPQCHNFAREQSGEKPADSFLEDAKKGGEKVRMLLSEA